jgi:hypothetical protein
MVRASPRAVNRSTLCQARQRSLFQFLGRFGAMMGEVSGFDLRAVLCVPVVTPETKADNSAGIGVSAPALAMGSRSLALF